MLRHSNAGGAYRFRTADGEQVFVDRVLPELPVHLWRTSALEMYQPMFTTTTDGIARAEAFGEPERWRVEWEQPYSRDEWLDVLPTQGVHTRPPPARLAELLAGLGAAVDALGGGFTMRYTTVAVTAVRSVSSTR